GTEQHSGHIESRMRFEIDFLNRETIPFDSAMNHSIQGSPLGHWPQTIRHENSLSKSVRTLLPCLDRIRNFEREMTVQILQLLSTNVIQLHGRRRRLLALCPIR